MPKILIGHTDVANNLTTLKKEHLLNYLENPFNVGEARKTEQLW